MAKVSVVTLDKTASAGLPDGLSGQVETTSYFAGPKDPLHLHGHRIAPGEVLRIGPRAVDCLVYVWTGAVDSAALPMPAGSSMVVEHGGTLSITGGEEGARILTFAAASLPEAPREGGHVHLLPVDRVARITDMIPGVNGGMHFDSACPTCELWLHESEFTPAFLTPDNTNRGAHCHSEDEIIFITGGQAQLGNKLFGPGTALAIHADTMYTFNPGAEGLSFINFRAARPGYNRRENGSQSDEADGWARQLGGKRPAYIEIELA